MIKIFIFANCHGATYKKVIESSAVTGVFEIEHVLSYENLDKFLEIRQKFLTCDILIIQPLEDHEHFKMENIAPLLKKACVVVKVPYVRFEGFWLPDDTRKLEKFSGAAVVLFPKIQREDEISDYLSGAKTDNGLIRDTFRKAINKLVALEKTGDIKFVGFFAANYKKRPLFRDAWHPTRILFQYIASQVANRVAIHYPGLINPVRPAINLSWTKEYGHFKPISDCCAKVLGLEYDLDSYFIYSRFEYLKVILRHENHGEGKISDLKQLKTLFTDAAGQGKW